MHVNLGEPGFVGDMQQAWQNQIFRALPPANGLPCDVLQGGEAARQMRNAPQPKYWGGPANRAGHLQVCFWL